MTYNFRGTEFLYLGIYYNKRKIMKDHKNNIVNDIKDWMKDDVDIEKLNRLKSQLGTVTTESLDNMISPIWDTYDNDSINERRVRLQQEARQKEKVIMLNRKYRRLQIAAILIPAIISLGFMSVYFGRQGESNYFELQAMKGEKSFLNLPDQSKVWINSESNLKYASDFNIKERHLYLEGEGFFDICHQGGFPFTVSVGDIDIVVKGTKFNVKTDPEEVEVALLEGKVDIFHNETQLIASLNPNQVININTHDPQKFTIKDGEGEEYGIWTQNKLMIQNENLFDISKKIEKWYGVNIQLSDVDPTQKYTFTIKTESLNETLSLMNQLMSIKYSVNGEEVSIRQDKN